MSKQRDSVGEVLRCFFMFGICCMHASNYGLHPSVWWVNCFYVFLDGFMLLSGWYGIRFSWKKFFSLWGIGLFCGLVDVIGYEVLIRGTQYNNIFTFMGVVKGKMFSHWYLNCYAALMLVAPLINEGLDCAFAQRDRIFSVLTPFFVLTFGWSWLFEKAARWFALPEARGLGSFTFLTLLGVYIVGRCCRHYEVDKLPNWIFVLAWFVGTFMCICGLGWYASPFTVLGAIGLFFVLFKMPWPNWFGRAALFVGPSMFSVYLLHEGPEGYWFVRLFEGMARVHVIIAICILGSGVLIDILLRRVPLAGVRRALKAYTR